MEENRKFDGRLVFLIPYYGEWPDWLEFTLRSFSACPWVRFILISDLAEPNFLPANVSMYRTSMEDLSARMAEALKIHPDIRHPFKLTDFKPAFGLIFRDLLEGYSHWGYADLDLLMGDLGGFLSRAAGSKADVISPSASLFPGHFMVFRNHEKTLNLFRKAENWEKVFSDARCYCFDERLLAGGLDTDLIPLPVFTRSRISRHLRAARFRKNPLLRMAANILRPVKRQLQRRAVTDAGKSEGGGNGYLEGGEGPGTGNAYYDFHSVISQEIQKGSITAFREQAYLDDVMLLESGKKGTGLAWKEGHLFCEGREILYYHFQLAKSTGGLSFRHAGPGEFELDINLQIL